MSGTRFEGRPRTSAARTRWSAACPRPAVLVSLGALTAGLAAIAVCSAVFGSCVTEGAGTSEVNPAEAAAAVEVPAPPSPAAAPEGPTAAPQVPFPAPARLQLRESSDLRAGFGPVTAQAWRRVGGILLTADYDRIQRWEADRALNLGAIAGSAGLIVDFSLFEPVSGTARLAVASRDGTLAVWDPDEGTRLASLPLDVDSAAWSPDGSGLAACLTGGRVLVLAWPGLGTLAELAAGPGEAPLRVSWLPSGKELVLGGASGALVRWKPGEPDARPLCVPPAAGEAAAAGTVPAVLSLAVSPDGSRVAAAGTDGTVTVLNLASGAVLVKFPAHRGAALSVAWSPDGSRLATGGEDKQVRVWQAADGTPHAMQHHNSLPVRSVAWRPGGSCLSSGAGSMDLKAHTGATILWQVP